MRRSIRGLQELFSKERDDADGFTPVAFGSRHNRYYKLPRICTRCAWKLSPGIPLPNGGKTWNDFIAFGYRTSEEDVYLPLYKKTINVRFCNAYKVTEDDDKYLREADLKEALHK